LSDIASTAKDWERVAGDWFLKHSPDELLAEHKKNTHLKLVARWAPQIAGARVLKTDLFEEAFGPDQLLFDLAAASGDAIGIDLCREIAAQARKRGATHGIDSTGYLCSDVRCLPFSDNSIDLIVSDSTLDHFATEAEIVSALGELARVLRVGGVLIVTMDNKRNLTYPPYAIVRLWMRLGLAPYFIGRTFSPGELRQALEEVGLEVQETTAIFHYPHPDGLVRLLERCLRRLSGGRLDNAVRRGLSLLDRLEGSRTRYLTGRYVAAKAVKRSA
jgi:ubiquinone/menaquinone biosynthesis C-methylase UbiE